MSLINYLRETKGEMAHVNWPTKKQATVFALVVILVSIFTAFFLGLFDFIFSRLLNLIIK
jgi:preprotein translocase SecE subunit